jgi:hypothetical protein
MRRRARVTWLVALLNCAVAAAAQTLPSFAELEAAGARIGEIRIVPRSIFDTSDPAEDLALFRLANRLHVVTRPEVVRRALLFAVGEPVSVRLIEETERALRARRQFHDVEIRPVAVREGAVDVEVLTRDTWTLEPRLSLGREGGVNDGAIGLSEYNLLGRGLSVGVVRASTVDRTRTELAFSGERAFGTQASLALSYASASDGRSRGVSLARPFDQLDARRAMGISYADDDRVEAVWRSGEIAGRYRYQVRRLEAHAGWSAGLVEGRVLRHTAGVQAVDESRAALPGAAAAVALPGDQTLVLPFLRLELLEDRYERRFNHDLVGRPEFFDLGLSARLQLGHASPATGSSRSALRHEAALGRGFQPSRGATLLGSARLDGEFSQGAVRRQQLGLAARYYLPQGPRRLFYAGAAFDRLTRPDVTTDLLLGGDNGLRGYPLRHQGGTRRILLTVEQRVYTDLYLWELFRIGGAAFADLGRAWGGDAGAAGKVPWRADVGVGLRIVSVRSAFGNVLHVDLAFPVDAPAGVRRVQWLVRTKTSF